MAVPFIGRRMVASEALVRRVRALVRRVKALERRVKADVKNNAALPLLPKEGRWL